MSDIKVTQDGKQFDGAQKLARSREKIEKMKRQLGFSELTWEDFSGGLSDREMLEKARMERALQKGWLE